MAKLSDAVVVLIMSAALTSAGASYRPQEAKENRASLDVAAASDLKFAMDDTIQLFRKRNPGVTVGVIYGSSGNFFSQLIHRAPFDMFFSADAQYPRQLDEQGMAIKGSYAVYALGRIVVWTTRASKIDVGRLEMRALLDSRVRHIAIANPRHAPYGRAAEAAMKSFGLYEQVKQKLVYGENVAQTAQFVETGSADVGIIALSLALAPALQKSGVYWEVPSHAYPKMEQALVISKWARDRPVAEAFRRFVLGSQGRAILKRYGFYLPEN